MEGSLGSPAGRRLVKAQDSAWECGTVHGWSQELNIDPIRHCQRQGDAEDGPGGDARFSGGRASKQDGGNLTAGCLD